ncbi:hypothetical protein [Streptomyces sp. CB01881]|uniref:hypothetical protein n=1 Tax=Streptomyces sp. CB01881 TaxID=2078691 RepID=UPI000CDBB865|nr:hypothetical protein [Streptomyces sp. CB01881]AUY50571.1 hypothetical protein C2142_18320 [Streptomyces sp. CB01881]TYC73958.1 hypothetical protein EH183_18300 [Streptomyces sp. CB01881]
MRVHRSAHMRNFTVLPNGLLQDRRLSYTARGLLADLLSRPDGWREDGRHMADPSPQGRGAIRKALKELTEAGYYRVEKIRMPDGTIRTETHVYDTPQLAVPGVTRPVSGEATTGRADVPLVKNRYQEPSHPAEQVDQQPTAGGETAARPEGREEGHTLDQETPAIPDERLREAMATLFRVLRAEPRLRLGEAEATELAPLVAQWLERGSTAQELAQALLPGLPVPLHSPVGVLRSRLKRKMPPVPVPQQRSKPRYAECAKCHDPMPQPGICAACAGIGGRTVQASGGAAVAAAGAARVRAALQAARDIVPALPALLNV